MTRQYGTVTYMVPGDAADPYVGRVGKTLTLSYGVNGRLPERTVEDAVSSVKKHLAEVLDARGGGFLSWVDDVGTSVVSESWEVRRWDEETAFRYPFAVVTAVGQDTSSGHPLYADKSQPMNVHLYPPPAQDSERAVLQADRLRSIVSDAIEFGGGRFGHPNLIPLWDFGGGAGSPDDPIGLYQDTEERQAWDFMRVVGLTTERFPDPQDDRLVAVVVNFRAQWRRVPTIPPGHLVESLRITVRPG